jgi:hypothetical protein
MLKRTVSFWRRLIEPRPSSADLAVLDEERRRAVRYPARGILTYQLAGDGEQVRGLAELRNISLGGISLVIDREFSPGDLLNLELGGGDGPSKVVLACVVHCTEAGANQWSLGCTFARELAEEDLLPFTGQTSCDALVEQRIRPRYSCDLKVSYQRASEPAEDSQPASVLNISTTGVGLLVREPLAAGTLLNITLGAVGESCAQTILSCVVHVTAQQDAEWALGCNFISELCEEYLKQLVC